MKQILSDSDRARLDEKISEAEKLTRAQIVLAVVGRSGSYPDIPWKAFALGSSVTGFAIFLYDLFVPEWFTFTAILGQVSLVLASGASTALLTLLFPRFASLFIPAIRKETETFLHAESLFMSHELFATEGRRGILLLVSQFERQVVILPDKGIRDRLNNDTLKSIISRIRPHLRNNDIRIAMETGLSEIVKVLSAGESSWPDKNELSDEIIEEGRK